MRWNVFISIYLLLCCTNHRIHFCDGQTLQDMKDLLADKLAGYNTDVRPVANQADPVHLSIKFELLSLVDIDEVTQTVTVNAMFGLNWIDASMAWNAPDYGGIYTTFAKSESFWTPPLVLVTSTEKLKKFGDVWAGIHFTSTGTANFYPAEICHTSCTMDITYFPFDQHACVLQFIPWGLPPSEMVLNNTSSKVDKTYYKGNGAWELTDSEITIQVIPGELTYYNVKLFLKRLSTFVVVNVIIPLICLSFLNILVFLIPTDSGERISFCLTLLLSIAVFLTIISDDLPKISVPMSLFSYYLLAVLILSAFVTIAVLFSLRLYFTKESKPVGTMWKRLVSLLRFQCLNPSGKKRSDDEELKNGYGKNAIQPVKADKTLTDNVKIESPPIKFKSISNKAWQSQSHENKNNNISKLDSMECYIDEGDDISWKDVSVAFDKLCFVLFTILLAVSTVSMFVVLKNGSR